ncbi:hypothetical protein HK104_006423 [Borealophlyctis nickersoniae]|nr:hypothetical protein HK104_006423 [Borealophlyctis nickersoniae]
MHGSAGGPTDFTATYLAKRFTCFTPQMDPSDLSKAVQLHTDALEEFKPQVVVGESFGCAVAHQLIESGKWKGPTVYMCPAVHRIRERFGITSEPIIPSNVPVVIIHGKHDTVIPYDDTQRLVQNTQSRLVKLHVVDDDHGMRKVVETDELKNYVNEALSLHE